MSADIPPVPSDLYREAFLISNPEEEILLTLREKGNAALKSKNFEIAIATFQEGVDTAEALNHLIAHASFLNNLAIAKEKLGKLEDAYNHHFESLDISKKINFAQGIDNSLTNIGLMTIRYYGKFELGMEYLHAALSLAIDMGDEMSAEWTRKKIDRFVHIQENLNNSSTN